MSTNHECCQQSVSTITWWLGLSGLNGRMGTEPRIDEGHAILVKEKWNSSHQFHLNIHGYCTAPKQNKIDPVQHLSIWPKLCTLGISNHHKVFWGMFWYVHTPDTYQYLTVVHTTGEYQIQNPLTSCQDLFEIRAMLWVDCYQYNKLFCINQKGR